MARFPLFRPYVEGSEIEEDCVLIASLEDGKLVLDVRQIKEVEFILGTLIRLRLKKGGWIDIRASLVQCSAAFFAINNKLEATSSLGPLTYPGVMHGIMHDSFVQTRGASDETLDVSETNEKAREFSDGVLAARYETKDEARAYGDIRDFTEKKRVSWGEWEEKPSVV